MKKNRFPLFSLIISFVALCLTLCAFADTATTYETVITYDTESDTVFLDVYVADGTAIAGYCNFKYDNSVLSLIDKNGNTVPASVPDYMADGKTTYLQSIISSYNGADITDVKRGASNLISTKDGYLFFAWAIPSKLPAIDSSTSPVKIASAKFDVIGNALPDKDSIIVAKKQYTDTVDNWFTGMIVINEAKKAYIYNGDKSGKEYYSSVFKTVGQSDEPADEPTDKPADEPTDEPADEPTDEPADEPTDEPADEPTDEPADEPTDEPADEPTDEPADEPTDEPADEPTDEPSNNGNGDCPEVGGSTASSEVSSARQENFSIEITSETDNARIKWSTPEGLDIDSYTLVICDDGFNIVKKISGISSVSTSYTVSDLYGDTEYNIYLLASGGGKVYMSDVYTAKTSEFDSYPPVTSYTVTYDKSGTYLYGFTSESVLYGSTVSKVPSVMPKDSSVFIGWSKDGKNVIDIYSEKIYADTTFYPVLSSKKATSVTYISGYSDGSFRPSGNITRAEAATIISRISTKYSESTRYCHTFTDCPDGMWYEKAVAFCSASGYIKGYADGTFNPDGNITRAEFATILVRVFGYDNILGLNVFSDLDGHWAKDYVSVLYSAGVLFPDSDGKFRPDEKLTREDAVTMINRCLGTIPDRQAILEDVKSNGYKFTDVPQYSDSFYDIMAAVMN